MADSQSDAPGNPLRADLPRTRVAERDRWGLRAAVALTLVTAFAFSFGPGGGSIADAFSQRPAVAPVAPRVDAWVTPPAYTGRAPIFLTAETNEGVTTFTVPTGSEVTLRVAGGAGDDTLAYTEAGGNVRAVEPAAARTGTTDPSAGPDGSTSLSQVRRFAMKLTREGELNLTSAGQILGRWGFAITPDKPPRIAFAGDPKQAVNGALELRYSIADDYGADLIGIQYQQGLKDLAPASDLVEGLLNNVDRPPVTSRDGSRILFEGRPLPHFNEVDQGAGVDILVTNRVWRALGLDPAATLHDVRWGGDVDGTFVWEWMISGAVPASHLGGYDKAESFRQPVHFFPKGGGTLAGVCKPGEIVWSRVFVMDGVLHADLGRGRSVELSADEVRRRLDAADPQWPILNVVLDGVDRDQFMARHRANHVEVAYAPDRATADRALAVKAAMFDAMGIRVHLCGDVAL